MEGEDGIRRSGVREKSLLVPLGWCGECEVIDGKVSAEILSDERELEWDYVVWKEFSGPIAFFFNASSLGGNWNMYSSWKHARGDVLTSNGSVWWREVECSTQWKSADGRWVRWTEMEFWWEGGRQKREKWRAMIRMWKVFPDHHLPWSILFLQVKNKQNDEGELKFDEEDVERVHVETRGALTFLWVKCCWGSESKGVGEWVEWLGVMMALVVPLGHCYRTPVSERPFFPKEIR